MLSIPRRAALFTVAVAAVLPLSACAATVGGQGRLAVADFPSPTLAVTPSATTSAPGTGPADDLVRRVRNSLMSAGDLVVDATLHSDDVDLHVTGRYSWSGASAVVTVGMLRIEVLGVGNEVYVKAPRAYWDQVDVKGAGAVTSEQWVEVEDQDNGPAAFGTSTFPMQTLLPDSSLTLSVAGESDTGGRHTDVVEDEDGWKYTIVDDPSSPQVVHVEHAGDTAIDVSHPTDQQTLTAPPASSVVTLAGY